MINTVWVHCAATKPDQDIGVTEIRQWHLDKGWNDIGYHYVIRRSGAVEKGRPDNIQGAHTYGYNENSLGICLVGGIDELNRPDANFTFAQYTSLINLIADLKAMYGTNIEIKGHRDVSSKSCPCFSIQSLVEYI